MNHQDVPGLSLAKAPTGDCCVRRPIASSLTMIGKQIRMTQTR